jgi:hypothetical protein
MTRVSYFAHRENGRFSFIARCKTDPDAPRHAGRLVGQ